MTRLEVVELRGLERFVTPRSGFGGGGGRWKPGAPAVGAGEGRAEEFRAVDVFDGLTTRASVLL